MTITIDNIKKLAEMARVDMDQNEMQEIANSFDSILSYVGQIQEISNGVNDEKESNELIPHNIMRDDVITNNGGEYTDDILSQAPEAENGYLKVKQIL